MYIQIYVMRVIHLKDPKHIELKVNQILNVGTPGNQISDM